MPAPAADCSPVTYCAPSSTFIEEPSAALPIGSARPPPQPPSVPRDEFVLWLDGDPNADDQGEKKDKDDVIDVSELGNGNGDGTVDSPVTSGADPSSWDPINVDGTP